MGMGGRINRQGGYQQSPYSGGFGSYQPPMYGGGGYSFSPSKGGGFGGYNPYQQTPTPEPFSQMEPFDVSGKPMQPQGNPPLTQPPPNSPPSPLQQPSEVPGRPTRGLAGFGPEAEGFPRGMPTFTPPTPPQQDPNFVYQPPSWLGNELAASTSTNPLKTGESMAEERRLEREKWSQPGYEGPMHSCPSPKEHIQLANNDWILAGNLKVGDEVATSEKPEKVTRVERIERSPRCEVLFQDSDSIVTSYSHPYFVNNKGFVKVSDLKKGDQVGDLVVKDKKPFSDGPVISLSVDKAETYMLRGGTEENPVPALSHNKTPMQGRVYDPNSPRAMEDWKNRRDSFVWTMPGTEAWQEWDERRQRREQSKMVLQTESWLGGRVGASGMQGLNGDRETARTGLEFAPDDVGEITSRVTPLPPPTAPTPITTGQSALMTESPFSDPDRLQEALAALAERRKKLEGQGPGELTKEFELPQLTNIFGQTPDEAAATGPLGVRPSSYGSPGKGMRPQPYGGGFGGGFGGYQPPMYGGRGYSSGPNKGGIFGGGFGNYQQPYYGGGFGGGAFNQGYGMQGGIGSLLPNYSSYMSPRMPFNPYVR
tara:strand:- start:30 stop:1811 length:1782 start_codon:yes stop_codon:yes gene_type:complete